MKRVYLFIFIAIGAIAMLVVSMMGFSPRVEGWSSFFAGFGAALLLLMGPSVFSYFKKLRQRA